MKRSRGSRLTMTFAWIASMCTGRSQAYRVEPEDFALIVLIVGVLMLAVAALAFETVL